MGSSTYLTDNFGRPSHYYETLPFGEIMVAQNQSSYYRVPYPTTNKGRYENGYKFNGKELDDATQMYYYGARYYDPRISIFVSVDPLAEETFEPYSYVGNNPIMFTDPTGMSKDGVETDYTLDRKTGEVKQHGEKNNQPDRIVEVKKNGDVKVKIDDIAKGILKDGMNLKTEGNLIPVNGENLPTTEDVEDFALKLQGYVGKEIGGMYLSENANSTKISHVTIGRYERNEFGRTRDNGQTAMIRGGLGRENMRGFFHTHPKGDRTPSRGDLIMRNTNLSRNPNLYFNIITDRKYGDPSGKIHRTNYTNYGR